MKTPEEIKKGLQHCAVPGIVTCMGCPYDDGHIDCTKDKNTDALAYVLQLESTYSQVSKALCDKENATQEELLRVVSQLQHTLEVARAERDATNKNAKEDPTA